MTSNLRLGCSGWSYDEWVGPIYKSTKESKLATYSRIFNLGEINSTFYRNPTKGMVYGWRRYSPDGFLFTAKIPQTVTHDKMLDVEKGVEKDLKDFCELMRLLSDSGKLRCLLIQLPPRLRFQSEKVKKFFEILPDDFEYAIEFRNHSWMCEDAYKLLKDFKIAYTIVDEPLLPPDINITSNFAYVRWHGKGKRPWYNYKYGIEELKPWVPKLKDIAKKTNEVYGFFNNHYHGYAPENCLQVLEMLGVITSEQTEAKKRIDDFREGMISIPQVESLKPKVAALTDFKSMSIEDMNVDELLDVFMDKGRLRRAREIEDKELEIEELSSEMIKAKIRDYFIIVDIINKKVTHNCGDWSRCIVNKGFCKHLGKLMLAIPKEKAEKIMRNIQTELELWDFAGTY